MSKHNYPKLGHLITNSTNNNRDAVHIAIIPVIAAEFCPPGIHVSLVEGKPTHVEHTSVNDRIGIIDPFLTEGVEPEERCYLFIYPETITSLAHVWTHPAFAELPHEVNPESSSIVWIKAFADKLGFHHDKLIRHAERWIEFQEGVFQGEDFADYGSSEEWEQFWLHYKITTGQSLPENQDSRIPFRCAC